MQFMFNMVKISNFLYKLIILGINYIRDSILYINNFYISLNFKDIIILLGSICTILTFLILIFKKNKPNFLDCLKDCSIVLDSKKKIFQNAQFFRAYGPTQIDFEEGIIVERNEVIEIEKALNQKSIVVLMGEPASGKTVIIRNIGYNLSIKGTKVTFLELKGIAISSNIIQEKKIKNINNLNGVLIIDDGHNDVDLVERILENCRHLKIIISTRPIEMPGFCSRYALFYDELKNAFPILSSNIADLIISHYFGTSYVIPHEIFKQYSQDLWFLAIALSTYKEHGSITMTQLDDYVVSNMINRAAIEHNIQETEDILLILSVFFTREIPIYRDFLIDKLNVSSKDLDKLVNVREIVEYNSMLSLYHSSMAKLVLNAYRKNNNLGWRIKRKMLKDFSNWEYGLFHVYLRWLPPNYYEVFRKIRFENNLVKEILENDLTTNAIFKRIERLFIFFWLNQICVQTKHI